MLDWIDLSEIAADELKELQPLGTDSVKTGATVKATATATAE